MARGPRRGPRFLPAAGNNGELLSLAGVAQQAEQPLRKRRVGAIMDVTAADQAKIAEERIEAYRGTVSLPLEPGAHKRIAVKIVDDRGIESLKVIDLNEVG